MSSRDRASPPIKRKRAYNVRLIKRTWPYTVQEVAELFGVHKNAVLRWLKEGLKADRDQRPFLIPGHELALFLKARRARHRATCSATEFYCFKCRTPREAYLGIADVVIESTSRVRVKALCSVCSTPVNKVQRATDLPKIETRFSVQQLAGRHMIEAAVPSVNGDSENAS